MPNFNFLAPADAELWPLTDGLTDRLTDGQRYMYSCSPATKKQEPLRAAQPFGNAVVICIKRFSVTVIVTRLDANLLSLDRSKSLTNYRNA